MPQSQEAWVTKVRQQLAKTPLRHDVPDTITRPRKSQAALSVGHSLWWDVYVRHGLVRLVNVGPKAKGQPTRELHQLIDALKALRDQDDDLPLKRNKRLSQRLAAPDAGAVS